MQSFKTVGKKILCTILEWQVRRLRLKNQFTLIAVAGSVGKTSTKTAIATALSTTMRVQYQAGNYNDRLTVPLILFGHTEPPIFAIQLWLKLLIDNERQLTKPYPYDVTVVELGSDGPGQMKYFAYLQPEISVLTAITPEHMEFFKTMAVVAEEETKVFDYSQKVIINNDLVDAVWLKGRPAISYGRNASSSYRIVDHVTHGVAGQQLQIRFKGQTYEATTTILGKQGASIALSVFAAACELGVKPAEAIRLLAAIRAVPGRMQLLAGINGSTLIDDTYNASLVSMLAALDALYAIDAPQRIAILGSMNELGDTSPDAHRQVGAYCDPGKLALVVTIGQQAAEYLAPAAQQAGCTVKSFESPYAAGSFLVTTLQPGAVVLAKGSQNLIYAEEAIKPLLAEVADSKLLVRQNDYWLRRKASQFADVPRP